MSESSDVSRLLHSLAKEEIEREPAYEQLLESVYTSLRPLAARLLVGERKEHTLGATALVHEAYLRLIGYREVEWSSRQHFLRVAAQAMRRVLVDHARKKRVRNEAAGTFRTQLLENAVTTAREQSERFLALDAALARLRTVDARAAEIVDLRYFAGLSVEETAQVLEVSKRTVNREWTWARTWLYDQLARSS